MSRRTQTDEQWSRIKNHLPGRIGPPGRSGADNRLFVDAILWMAGNTAHCAIYRRFLANGPQSTLVFGAGRMRASGRGMFHALADMPDFEYVLIDSTISKVHADATGAKGGLKLRPSVVRVAD